MKTILCRVGALLQLWSRCVFAVALTLGALASPALAQDPPTGATGARAATDQARAIAQLLTEGSYREAEAAIQSHFARRPRPPIVDYWQGFIYLKTGRWAEAESSLLQALAVRQDRAAWHHALAWALQEQGRFAAAAERFARAVDLEPRVTAYHFDRAWCALSMGNTAVADLALQQALALEPNHAAALATLGGLRLDQGDAAAAQTLLAQALRANPAPDLFFQFGVAARSLGDGAGAQQAFSKVLAEVPGHVGALYNQAQLLRSSDPAAARAIYAQYQVALERQESIENRQAYLRLSPEDFGARAELVDLLLAAGRSRDALEALNAWHRVGGERPEIWQRYAIAWRRLGRTDLAQDAERNATRP